MSPSALRGSQFGSLSASYDLWVAKFMVGYAKSGSTVEGFSLGVTAPVAGFNVGALYGKNSRTQQQVERIRTVRKQGSP